MVEPGALLSSMENFKGRVTHYDTGMASFAVFLKIEAIPASKTKYGIQFSCPFTALRCSCCLPENRCNYGSHSMPSDLWACWQTQHLSEEARKLKVLRSYRILLTHKIHQWANSPEGTCQIQQGSLRAEDQCEVKRCHFKTAAECESAGWPSWPLTLESPNSDFPHFFPAKLSRAKQRSFVDHWPSSLTYLKCIPNYWAKDQNLQRKTIYGFLVCYSLCIPMRTPSPIL